LFDTSLGDEMTSSDFADAVEKVFPDAYNASTLAKIGRNTASSWEQSGHLQAIARTVKVIGRPRRLVFAWSSPYPRFRESIVTVAFQPSSSSTVVEIHQVGFRDEEAQNSHYAGRSDVLGELGRTALFQDEG
jgi:uncharacterized protein YndB with AHSA1/START domain